MKAKKRDEWINFRLTCAEKTLLKMASDKANVTQSEIVRVGMKREIMDIMGGTNEA